MTEVKTELKTTTATPTKPEPPLAVIAKGLELRKGQFAVMLPHHISADHFIRVVMTAIQIDPELLAADRRSFYTACLRAASDGLLPDKREGALVTFKDRDSKQKLVTWMPMVYGLMKKIRQSGEIISIGARIVYQREIDEESPSNPGHKRFEFVISDGEERLYHDPLLWGDRGPKVLVYAFAKFKNGYVQYMPVHKDDVLKRRAIARTDKIWNAWEDEMFLKTAIRAIAARLPLSAEVMSAIERDENMQTTEFDKLKNEAIAALAAPVEQVEENAGDSVLQQDERRTVTAEEFIKNATKGLSDPDFTTVAELEEYAQRIRQGLADLRTPASEFRRLADQFQQAFVERINEIAPQ